MTNDNSYVLDRHGRRRPHRRGETLADGEALVVPPLFMDSRVAEALAEARQPLALDSQGFPVGHRPGFVDASPSAAAAQAAAQAREAYIRRISDAWRHNTPAAAAAPPPAAPAGVQQDAAQAAREAYIRRTSTAWRAA